MKTPRIGSALAGLLICAITCLLLWPHARDGWAILAAQDDPPQLANLQINSALRNSGIDENIEAALAAGDADLAGRFVEVAREKNIPVGDGVSCRRSVAG